MLDSLISGPGPFIFLIVVFPLCLVAVAAAYLLTVRFGRPGDEKEESAFGLGQAAIFGLIALILAFSFSFAAERFEARRALVVNEADAIGTAYLRGDFLPAAQQAGYRKTMITYVKTRLETYADVTNARAEQESVERGKALQGELWRVASTAARTDPRNLMYRDLASAVNETIDMSEQQAAALDNHVPAAIMGIVLLSTLVGAALLGLTFGRAKSPNAVLSAIFCVLFAATVFTIVDLDHPQGGFIHVDVAPLQATLDDMRP